MASPLPSRQFLVQQAVLNTAAKLQPTMVRTKGVAAALRYWLAELNLDYEECFIGIQVRRQYSALLAQYSVAP